MGERTSRGGGTEPVREHPPERAGPARPVVAGLVAVLGILVLLIPILGLLGYLAILEDPAGRPGIVVLWAIWGAMALGLVWALVSLFRRG